MERCIYCRSNLNNNEAPDAMTTSTSTRRTARSFSFTPASSDWKTSCRSGAARSLGALARLDQVEKAPAVRREAEEDWAR